jgi:hypothetical protein
VSPSAVADNVDAASERLLLIQIFKRENHLALAASGVGIAIYSDAVSENVFAC